MIRGILLLVFSVVSACVGAGAMAGVAAVEDSVLVVPSGTAKIGAHAFEDRRDFHSVRFETPCSLVSIGEYAFLGCTNLREIELPASVTSVGQGAFRECEGLRRVRIPAGVKVLPRYLFAWCSGLEMVETSGKIEDIQAHAFAYCGSLGAFNFGRVLKHVGSNAFSFCSSLREVSLPVTVQELESYAFAECVSLETAVLPANSHLLGELIFSGCRNLCEIRELSSIPPKFDCNSTLFEDTERHMYSQCRLIVAGGMAARYRKAPGWNLFKDILVE